MRLRGGLPGRGCLPGEVCQGSVRAGEICHGRSARECQGRSAAGGLPGESCRGGMGGQGRSAAGSARGEVAGRYGRPGEARGGLGLPGQAREAGRGGLPGL